MDIERHIDKFILDLFNHLLHVIRVSLLHDTLTQVVSKLVDHNISDDWSNKVDEALGKSTSLQRLRLMKSLQ